MAMNALSVLPGECNELIGFSKVKLPLLGLQGNEFHGVLRRDAPELIGSQLAVLPVDFQQSRIQGGAHGKRHVQEARISGMMMMSNLWNRQAHL